MGLAMDSCAQFLAVAEHRFIPAGPGRLVISLGRAGFHSVWAPACQDTIPGGHAGVGVVSLGGATLALPSIVTPEFREFKRLGRALRTTLPTGKGGVVHLFVVYGYQGAEEDADKLRLTDQLLQAVLAEAQVVCIGQPLLILLGILMLILQSYPVWLRVCLLVGMLIWPLLIILGAGVLPDHTCTFNRDDGSGSRRDFFVGCPGALAASLMRVMLLIGGSLLTFLFLHVFVLMPGLLMFLALLLLGLSGLLAGWIFPDRSSSSSSRVVQDVWDVYRDVLGVVP